jgi:hypothetical protein
VKISFEINFAARLLQLIVRELCVPSMKGPERSCSIKPQQTSSRNVLQRPVEPAARSGRSCATDHPSSQMLRYEQSLLAHAMFHNI